MSTRIAPDYSSITPYGLAAMTLRAGELGNLWPLGLLLFVALSLPGMAFGKVGAWLRRKLTAG